MGFFRRFINSDSNGDSNNINIRPKPNQRDFSNIPFDYGKNIVNPQVQESFQKFLNIPANT